MSAAAAVAVAHSAVGMEEWRDRQRGSGLPTGHAWENRGREGRRVGKRREEEEDTGSRPSSIVPLPQKDSSSYRIWQSMYHFGERMTGLENFRRTSKLTRVQKCMSCDSFEWSKR